MSISITESQGGGLPHYYDHKTGVKMSHMRFVKRVELGDYPEYEIHVIDGVKMPVYIPSKGFDTQGLMEETSA